MKFSSFSPKKQITTENRPSLFTNFSIEQFEITTEQTGHQKFLETAIP